MDPKNVEDDHEQAGELLEQGWFFGNLLQTKSNSKSSSRMLRSFSDPCSSSNFPGKSYEETYETIKKGTKTNKSSSRKTASSSLVRAPSLPTTLDEEELEFSMAKLIRQASLNTRPLPLPPRQNPSKSLSSSPSLTPQRSMRLKSNLEVEELQGFKDLGFTDLDKSPGLQERRRSVEDYDDRRAPPVPRWGRKRAPEDMKAQLKFWARAVASNVRQEC